MWESHDRFKPHLDEVWQEEGKALSMHQLQCKLEKLLGSLADWGKNIFKNVEHKIKELNDQLVALRADTRRQEPMYKETKIV
jgi:hypothetical protein